jgi:hypothetical protein
MLQIAARGFFKVFAEKCLLIRVGVTHTGDFSPRFTLTKSGHSDNRQG